MNDFILKHKKLVIILLAIALVLFIGTGVSRQRAAKKEAEEQARIEEEARLAAESGDTSSADSYLMSMQSELEAQYGKVPDGFIWEVDGTILSLGDKDMTAEEVVYAYLRGLSSLDISTVQRYSRGSLVVETYNDYYNETNKYADYQEKFMRNMYKDCLLSLQIEGIENSAVFAENKIVFTINASMLDLTNKDFWKDDKEEIYKNLYLYDKESDGTKGEMYLYDYILSYYESEEAQRRSLTFDITVQKYPDLDSGWLVSIDTDVDDACKYRDGNIVVSYIQEMYWDEGFEPLLEEELNRNQGTEVTQ